MTYIEDDNNVKNDKFLKLNNSIFNHRQIKKLTR